MGMLFIIGVNIAVNIYCNCIYLLKVSMMEIFNVYKNVFIYFINIGNTLIIRANSAGQVFIFEIMGSGAWWGELRAVFAR